VSGEHPARHLGWSPFFQNQLHGDELDRIKARVAEVQRSGLLLWFDGGERQVVLGGRWFQLPPEERPTVGDWVVLNDRGDAIERVLERKTLLKRRAAGRVAEVQLMAANVDTLFLVTSANADFNPARLERYLALALEAGVEPVLVLTKIDLCDDLDAYLDAARALRRGLVVEAVNALDPASLRGLEGWCTAGQTIALLGSSGVGKSTLLNALAGRDLQLTGDIREDDGKGRHTTTYRSLHPLPGGALVVDNPGMRELAFVDSDAGLAEMFDDIERLAAQCRFRDCAHHAEPGCAVQAAIAAGDLDERRLASFDKLRREEQYNSETVAQRRARGREFGKLVRQVVDRKQQDSGRED